MTINSDLSFIIDLKFDGLLLSTKGVFSELVEIYKYNKKYYAVFHKKCLPIEYIIV